MFEHLAEFNQILVTGPQRSGTTICARMVAEDTGHEYIDEAVFNVHRWDYLQGILEAWDKIVVQCPAVAHCIHQVPDDALVVWMMRPPRDIIASQERIGWKEEPIELAKYRPLINGNFHGAGIAEVKNGFWNVAQKPVIKHWLEVEYDSLAEHPLWVPQELRTDWGPRRWWQ